jgi:acyl-CoA synthetase (AMP-forming)/AMP-acid ligase II
MHLSSGVDPDRLDLLAAGSLPAARRRMAEADPDRPALWAAGLGWVSRGELEQAGARVAGRRAFTPERLAGFKWPRVVHYVDALPRNALGKVLKHEPRG